MARNAVTTIEDLDALDPEAVITLERPSEGIERWTKVDGSTGLEGWRNMATPDNLPLQTRFFTGAVNSGYVFHVTGEDAEDPYRFDFGSVWQARNDPNGAVFVAFRGARERNNALGITANGSISQNYLNHNDVQTGYWRRVKPHEYPEWLVSGGDHRMFEALASVLGSLSPVVEAVKQHALEAKDSDLLELLVEHDVDMSVATTAQVTGITEVNPNVARQTHLTVAVTVQQPVEVPWEHQIRVRVPHSTCVCEDEWTKFLDQQKVEQQIPANREYAVTIACPLHPKESA